MDKSFLQTFDLSTVLHLLPDLPVSVCASNVPGKIMVKQRRMTEEACYRFFKKLKVDHSFLELETLMDLKYALIVKDIQRLYRYLRNTIIKELDEIEDKTKIVLFVRVPASYVELSGLDTLIYYQIVMEAKLGVLDE